MSYTCNFLKRKMSQNLKSQQNLIFKERNRSLKQLFLINSESQLLLLRFKNRQSSLKPLVERNPTLAFKFIFLKMRDPKFHMWSYQHLPSVSTIVRNVSPNSKKKRKVNGSINLEKHPRLAPPHQLRLVLLLRDLNPRIKRTRML